MSHEALVAAAATAAGPIRDQQDWIKNVVSITGELRRVVKAYDDHDQRIADAIAAEADGTKKRFAAKLVAVKKIDKGNGMVKGYLQFEAREDSQSVDEDGHEYIETLPLSTAAGKWEYFNAHQLIGQRVIVYKRLVPLDNGRKARECVAIEAA